MKLVDKEKVFRVLPKDGQALPFWKLLRYLNIYSTSGDAAAHVSSMMSELEREGRVVLVPLEGWARKNS